MNCTCGGELYLFGAEARTRGLVTDLPHVCRACGKIFIRGEEIEFPAGFQEKVAHLAKEASIAGADAVSQVLTDSKKLESGEVLIGTYFAKTYRDGYLQGFFRALAYWKSTLKEGRIRRLRAIWQDRTIFASPAGSSVVTVGLSSELYKEFDRLLTMGSGAKPTNGTSTPNQPPPR